MSDVFLEIIVNADDATAIGIASRDEIEDPLTEALFASGLGEVTGGGGGSGVYILDVEIETEQQFDEALRVLRQALKELKVPSSTQIKRHKPKETVYVVYQ